MGTGCELASSPESNRKYTVWSDLAASRMTGSLPNFTIDAAGSPAIHKVTAEKL